ncbi:hypothetical protein [Chryseobacterium sp. MEBOG07]|uniref:hypothetical protein n=1 Tax=Chryseobacterium sp. MEBOG07 TaxID=2879939 RepID=UPI001F21ED20|nr:hypothetical protein [Chryseobacterium sp. MEBOG07]UKB77614.1 hypothetical protein LF886_14040 [Chryseobacterium sp. MEBOG07]
MDKETVDYIIRYFSKLMNDHETLALKHQMSSAKSDENPQFRKIMIEKNWISSDPEITNLLENGNEVFKQNIVTRIMAETPEKVFFNNCPKCDKLARTPYARQCRYCGYNWHHLVVAQFKLNNTFQITGRQFFLIGEIIEGEIKEGQRIDLRILGLNKKPKIESIELALKRQDGKASEDIALGTNELTEEDKQYLKSINSFRELLDIVIE